MFTRFSFLALSLAVLLSLPLVSRGETNVPFEQRAYAVADLVIPVVDQSLADFFLMPEVAEKPCRGKPQTAPQQTKVARTSLPAQRKRRTLEDRLIQTILRQIEPSSWSENGGSATIEYHPLDHSLVVNQTAQNHERISELLSALRRIQDVEVAVEIRLVRLPEDLYPRLMEMVNLETHEACPCSELPCKSAGRIRSSQGRKLGYLKDRQVFQFIEAAQCDPRTNVMQAPKLTVCNGQTGVISATDQQFFVTGVKPVQGSPNEQPALVPVNQPFEQGVKFALKPAVSADRRSVRLHLKANLANLASENVPLFPVATFITPVCAGGAPGRPIPFTQFIQMPQFQRQTLDTKVVVADSGTVVFGGWKTTRELREVIPNDFMKELPILNLVAGFVEELTGCQDMFGSVAYHRESDYLVMLVTPRISVRKEADEVKTTAAVRPTAEAGAEEESEPCEPADHAIAAAQLQKKMVAELLAAYRAACTAGNHAEAHKLASMALALDPLCFRGAR